MITPTCHRGPVAAGVLLFALFSSEIAQDAGGSALAALPFPLPEPTAQGMTVRVCNDFNETVFVAFAYPDGAEWTSRGWFTVQSNACKNVRLPATTFSYRAETTTIQHGDTTTYHEWGGSERFCVRDRAFTFHPGNRRCTGGQLKDFSDTKRSSGVNTRVTFEEDGKHTDVSWSR